MTARQGSNIVEFAEMVREQVTQVLKPLEAEVARLYEMGVQNDRALRGNNGTIGVVARVEKLEAAMELLRKSVEMSFSEEKIASIVVKTLEGLSEKKQRDTLTKTDVFDRIIMPIIISGLSYILFTFMPKLFQIL